jgi:hypothetical protein
MSSGLVLRKLRSRPRKRNYLAVEAYFFITLVCVCVCVCVCARARARAQYGGLSFLYSGLELDKVSFLVIES